MKQRVLINLRILLNYKRLQGRWRAGPEFTATSTGYTNSWAGGRRGRCSVWRRTQHACQQEIQSSYTAVFCKQGSGTAVY